MKNDMGTGLHDLALEIIVDAGRQELRGASPKGERAGGNLIAKG